MDSARQGGFRGTEAEEERGDRAELGRLNKRCKRRAIRLSMGQYLHGKVLS